MAVHPLVVAIQDTTFLNYTHHPATAGLGPIGGGQRGLVMHSTLAVTPDALPLGVLEQQIWARPDPETGAKRTKQRPIHLKESHKWLTALRGSVTMTPSDIRLITVADREADIFEFLAEAEDLQAEYVIRAAQDRGLKGEVELLWAYMTRQAVIGSVTVEVPRRGNRPARTAELSVRVAHVTLQPPQRSADDPGVWLEPLEVWALWLHEDRPPEGVEALDWLLLTNVAIETWQDATERIGWYCLRPLIESWHKILKSGCTIEDYRLESAKRLKPYLTLLSIIAWRLFWLTHINRHVPDAACTTILADHEWKALYTAIHRRVMLPATPPTVREAIRWIAQLGGFLGRKGDGEPGITTLWRGWSRLTDMADLYLITHPSEDTDNS
jgi:transposase Tn5 family protein